MPSTLPGLHATPHRTAYPNIHAGRRLLCSPIEFPPVRSVEEMSAPRWLYIPDTMPAIRDAPRETPTRSVPSSGFQIPDTGAFDATVARCLRGERRQFAAICRHAMPTEAQQWHAMPDAERCDAASKRKPRSASRALKMSAGSSRHANAQNRASAAMLARKRWREPAR